MIEIANFITSLRVAVDIAKGYNSLHGQVERDRAVAELFPVIFSVEKYAKSVEAEKSLLVQEIAGLKKRIVEFENWDIEKSNHRSTEIAPRHFVVVSNNSDQPIEKLPWFCPNCWEDKKKSPLKAEIGGAVDKYSCPRCPFEFSISKGPATAKRPYRAF